MHVNCCMTQEDDEAFVSCEMYAGIVITYTIIFLNAGDVTGL